MPKVHPRLWRTTALAPMLCLCSLLSVAQSDPARKIDAILARPEAARSFWGVEITELDSGRVLYAHDANRLFAPASSAKLFVTAAGLALLGTEYRFRTTVETAVLPDKYGRLTGDLVLVGRGDPNLSGRTLPYHIKTERMLLPAHVLEELADQVYAKGVRYIDGDIVGDDSYFSRERYAVGWSEGDLTWEYGAPVSALSINDNVVFLNVMPGEHVGDRAFLSISPFADYYQIDNHLVTAAAGTPRKLAIQRDPGSHKVSIWGSIPADDLGVNEALAIENPAEFCAQLLRDMLAKRGVAIYGQPRARHAAPGADPLPTPPQPANGNKPLGPFVLATHESFRLGDDITVINKVSQNLHAELLLRLLGREHGTGGSLSGGLDALRNFLNSAGVDPQGYILYDGCGLSRQNLVSPHAFVQLLRYAARQSWGNDYLNSLPVAGLDGTLIYRLTELPAGATLHAKSGSYEHVNTLSGYLTTSRGQRLVISILANNHGMASRNAIDIVDDIVLEAEQFH